MHADILMEDESSRADVNAPRPSEFNPNGPSSGFEPSAKLRARVEKLAEWRIDRSSITFPEESRECCGGHATVSKAHRYSWREDVAIKKTRIADDTDLERALGLAVREAEFLVGVSHPNIIRFEGFVEDVSKNIIWLVFPWADNGNLKDFVSSQEWEIPERISLIDDVAVGLGHLHSQQPPICHGDLKSLNVLVNWDGRAVIADLGSARRLSHTTQVEPVESRPCPAQPLGVTFCTFTNTITLTGNKYTLRWAAPELLLEDQLSLWSDIWALGWIIYEVMTNSLPFQDASTDIIVVERVLGGELPSLTDNAHLSLIHELCSLMTMCWQSNPIERPTASYCQQLIKQMPTAVPESEFETPSGTSGPRFRSAELLRQLGHMYQSRGRYATALDCFVEALENSRTFHDVKIEVSSLCGLAQLYRLQGEYERAIPLYSRALEVWNDLSDGKGKAEALRGLTKVHGLQEEYDEATGLYAEALEIWTDLGERRKCRADALWGLAQVHQRRKEYDKAIPLYSEALDIRTDLGDGKGRADTLWGLAEVYRLEGEYDKAVPLYSEVLDIRTDLGDGKGRADALWGLAEMYRLEGEYDKAVPLYSEVLDICTDLGDGKGRAGALWGLAEVYRLEGEYDKAVPLYSEVLDIRTDLGDGKGRADALWGLADMYRLEGEYDKAVPLYSEVLDIRTDLGDGKGRADALWGLAELYRRRNEYDKAVPLYSEVLDIRTDLGDGKGRAGALWGVAEMYRLEGEYDKAVPLYSEVLDICTDLGDGKGRADALWGLAELYRRRNEYDKAVPLYSEVLDVCTDLGDGKGRADALWGLAELYRRRNEYDKAVPLYSEVLDICTDLGDGKGRIDAICRLADVRWHRNVYDKAIRLYSQVLSDCIDFSGLAGVNQRQNKYAIIIPLHLKVLDSLPDLGNEKDRGNRRWFIVVEFGYEDDFTENILCLKIRTAPGIGRFNTATSAVFILYVTLGIATILQGLHMKSRRELRLADQSYLRAPPDTSWELPYTATAAARGIQWNSAVVPRLESSGLAFWNPASTALDTTSEVELTTTSNLANA